jgi:hypothetical protein
MEAGGIASVIISVQAFKHRLTPMSPPRVLLTPFMMGRPIGPPNDPKTQSAVLKAALSLLAKAEKGGTFEEFNTRH